jgi:hypothetical protein
MLASEPLINEGSLSQRIGYLKQADIRGPELGPRLWSEQGGDVAVGRSRSEVLNKDARIDYKGSLSDLGPPSPTLRRFGS